MLTVKGKVLEVESETVEWEGKTFDSTKIKVLTGKASIETVTVGKNYPVGDLPTEGESVELEVSVYAKGGYVRMTAISRVRAGLRAAAPVAAPVAAPGA